MLNSRLAPAARRLAAQVFLRLGALGFLCACVFAPPCFAQQPAPTQTPAPAVPIAPGTTPTITLPPTLAAPTDAERDEQSPVKIYTQEILLPVVAYDAGERFDPTLEPEDVLVMENDVPQQVKSVRRVPASVLLVFDMGGQVTATHNSDTARESALRIIRLLRDGDRLAIVQNGGNHVELLQDWTDDLDAAMRVLKTKYFSGNRSRLAECLRLATGKLEEQPVGNTHLVVFSDGLEAQSREEIRAGALAPEMLRQLASTQASVHVFGFAALISDFVVLRNNPVRISGNGRTVSVIIDTDVEMRRWFRNYALAMRQRQETLATLARETGGRILLSTTTEEVVKKAEKVSRDIAAQYVVTYKPKRPFEPATGERRRVSVSARRVGLQLFTLRSYVAAPAM